MRVNVDSILWDYHWKERGIENPFEEVGSLDEPNLSYEFHTLGVFRHKPTGRMWYATTSGCSCPSPFEEYSIDLETLESDMTEITPQTLDGFLQEVKNFCPEGSDRMYGGVVSTDDKRVLTTMVQNLLKERK